MKNTKKKNSITFINECVNLNLDKYDYSLVNYVNNKVKVDIICKIHGIFRQTPNNHLSKKQQCPKCSDFHFEKKNNEQIIIDFQRIHGEKYDYSKVQYDNSKIKVEIICKKHGSFFQTPNNHLKGQDCPECLKFTTEDFIQKANKIHNYKYSYNSTKYSSTRDVLGIVCKEHGLFKQKAHVHLSGCGCPMCGESKGERMIRFFLQEKSIDFISQYNFVDCKLKKPLKFDFYVPKYNCCIEFDGDQHRIPVKHFGGEIGFLERTIRDDIKNEYCSKNNIKLIRINKIQEIEYKLTWLT